MGRRIGGLSILGIVMSICLGVVIGSGGYTFHYGQGTSYLSNDPTACTNCHVMNDHFAGWQKSSHHHVATCNDCHVPHDLVGKYLTKAENGYLHSRAFTFEDFHEPIEMRPRSERVLTSNCVHCHADAVHALKASSDMFNESANCLHCHRSVGHGPIR